LHFDGDEFGIACHGVVGCIAADIGSGRDESELVGACAAGHVAAVEAGATDFGERDGGADGGAGLVCLSGDGEARSGQGDVEFVGHVFRSLGW